MKLVAFVLVAGSSLLAQRTGSGISPSSTGFGRLSNPSGLQTSTAGGGFGRLVYPGTGGPPAVARGTGNAGGGARVVAPPVVGHSHSRSVIVPYPVYYGGYYYGYDAPPAAGVYGYGGAGGYGNDPGYAYDPNNYGSQQQSPVVIINQNFRPDTVNPVIHDYTDVPLPPAPERTQGPGGGQAAADDAAQIVFLIAMKDHTIFPAVAYWVEGDTLNYITLQGIHNRATLDLVDREFSQQLNSERRVDFALPPPK